MNGEEVNKGECERDCESELCTVQGDDSHGNKEQERLIQSENENN